MDNAELQTIRKYTYFEMDNNPEFSLCQKLSFEINYSLSRYYGFVLNKALFNIMLAVLVGMLYALGCILAAQPAYVAGLLYAFDIFFGIVALLNYRIMHLASCALQLASVTALLYAWSYAPLIASLSLVLDVLVYATTKRSESHNEEIIARLNCSVLLFLLSLYYKVEAVKLHMVFIVFALAYLKLTKLSGVSVYYWMVNTVALGYRSKYKRSVQLDYSPTHKSGSSFILLELFVASNYAVGLYMAVAGWQSVESASTSPRLKLAFIVLSLCVYAFNLIVFAIVLLRTRYIAKSENYVKAGTFENPFYVQNVKTLERFNAQKCYICTAQPLELLYECGHAVVCFNCWNQPTNEDYRAVCMVCKRESATIKKIYVANYCIDVHEEFVLKV